MKYRMKISLEISYAEFVSLAALMADERQRETATGLLALAHAVKNRMSYGEQISNILNDLDFSSRRRELEKCQLLHTPVTWEIVSLLSSVFDGASEDPTEGARRFHRHDTNPDWAKSLQPKALIGGRFYYS